MSSCPELSNITSLELLVLEQARENAMLLIKLARLSGARPDPPAEAVHVVAAPVVVAEVVAAPVVVAEVVEAPVVAEEVEPVAVAVVAVAPEDAPLAAEEAKEADEAVVAPVAAAPRKKHRSRGEMRKVLRDREIIIHSLQAGSTWRGCYEQATNRIILGGRFFETLGAFETAHKETLNQSGGADGWKHCYVMREGERIAVGDLPSI